MDAGGGALPLPECDIFAGGGASGCADDEKCAVVLHQPTDDPEDNYLFHGCVPLSTGARPEGIVCGRWDADPTPGDPDDELYTDDCAEGLWCAVTSGTVARCTQLCGDDRVECEETDYCANVWDDPFFGICIPADDCDPIAQAGCTGEEACYYVRTTMDQFIGSCFDVVLPDGGTGMPGDPCMFINNCVSGSQCLPDLLADGGLGDTAACRELCARGLVDGGVAPDAGDPMDGGTAPTGDCPAGETCNMYPFEGTFRGPYEGGFCI
jgi:hypothetical protein